MLIFVNEERSYLSWLSHHRHGFVLDMLRRPTRKHPILHRATCGAIKKSKSKRTHWTTGRHVKACTLEIEELLEWANMEFGKEPVCCAECKPTDEAVSRIKPSDRHLTKLGREIMDYITDSAVICFDQDDVEYDVTLDNLAAYLKKTPAHLQSALVRLVEDGYVRIEGNFDLRKGLPGRRQIYPTADAMRTLPFFHQMSIQKVKMELERLTGHGE